FFSTKSLRALRSLRLSIFLFFKAGLEIKKKSHQRIFQGAPNKPPPLAVVIDLMSHCAPVQ
ncbi:hypothetical protein JW935_27955, partial [candidate division KSB1 bacterium]|nr:hypothetical protein [candidate division KSB1 bacterium]